MATRVESEVVVSIVSSLRTSIDGLDERDLIRNSATIHQIPIDVRKGNENAYTPMVVSIGPYHRNLHQGSYLHEQTRGMKILFLKDFLHRTGPDKMNEYASLIESREEEARDCYHDRCKGLESEEFVQMMVLDGCFIVEFFLKWNDRDNHLFFTCKMEKYLRDLEDDLMLMENQTPFFILRLILDNSGLDLYEVQGDVHRRVEILDLFLPFLQRRNIKKNMLEPTHREGDGENVYHLLHLSYLCHMVEIIPEMESPPETLQGHLIEKTKCVLYFIAYGFLFLIKCFLLLVFYALVFLLLFIKLASKIMWQKPDMHNRQKVKAKKEKSVIIPTATELNEFGVTFKRKKDAKNSIDVSFENRIMEIPVVNIEDSSNLIFRNYLALEQNCHKVGNKFSRYVVFMNNLVDTTSDVALLKKSKIIESVLGCDEEVAKFFNGLTVGLVFDYNSLNVDRLFEDVRVHCNKDHNRWRAKLTRDYFSSPWSIISLLGAVTLLAFSATQVTYAVKNSRRM